MIINIIYYLYYLLLLPTLCMYLIYRKKYDIHKIFFSKTKFFLFNLLFIYVNY